MKKIKVSKYLAKTIEKLGVTEVFGVPGDYSFKLIEAVESSKTLNWIGSTNELNAGYSADGYARIKGAGVLITTYGVGELSCINSLAGSAAENIPILMLVGMPSTEKILKNKIIHHNLFPPDYCIFTDIFSKITAKAVMLTKSLDIKKEIDECIEELKRRKSPVYIAVPQDICDVEIDDNPSDINIFSNEKNLIKAADEIIKALNSSQNPIAITGSRIRSLSAVNKLKSFLKKSSIPFCSFLMGKGIINESSDNYLGTFLGEYVDDKLYKFIKNSDCIISIGTIFSDFNLFGYDLKSDICIYEDYSIVKNCSYENISMTELLDTLNKNILEHNKISFKMHKIYPKTESPRDVELTSSYLYARLEEFLESNDILINDVGISMFGIAAMTFPDELRFENQYYWASIGWATPALLGICLADKSRRAILITGEGAHQLTIQELSNIISKNLNPIIIVLNNYGYTIERTLSKDFNAKYNNITSWKYLDIPNIFGDRVFTGKATTEKELDDLLKIVKIEQTERMCYLEIFTSADDIPDFGKYAIKNLKKK